MLTTTEFFLLKFVFGEYPYLFEALCLGINVAFLYLQQT